MKGRWAMVAEHPSATPTCKLKQTGFVNLPKSLTVVNLSKTINSIKVFVIGHGIVSSAFTFNWLISF